MSRRGRGEGTIYHRKDGRWEGALRTDGRRIRWVANRRSEVQQQLSAAIHAREIGAPVPARRATFGKFWTDWLPGMRSQVRPRTLQLYEQIGRSHLLPVIGSVPLVRLTAAEVRRIHERMLRAGLSPTTVRHAHRVLHRALADAVRWDLVARNVATLVTAPRDAPFEIHTLAAEEVQELLAAAAGDRLEALYALAVTTGMRQGELLGLRWRDVDLPKGRLSVRTSLQSGPGGPTLSEPKTPHSRRQLLLTPEAMEALGRRRRMEAEERLAAGPAWRDSDLVFPNTFGGPMDRRNLLRRQFAALLTRAGLPTMRFHDLRHTAATLLLSEGIHPKIVSEMLGHAGIAITLDLYSHVSETMQQGATEVMSALVGGRHSAPRR